MKKTRHIIIDNETLDVTPSAVLLTIAAVAVEISDGKAIVLGRWYRQLDYMRQHGRTKTADTFAWWKKQDYRAHAAAFGQWNTGTPLHIAMHSLNAWLQLNPYPIWGNGVDFDNAQLQDAFSQHELRWPFWRNRCLRSLRGTVLQLYPETVLPDFPADKIKHHALHDAEHEANVLAALLQTLAAHPGPPSWWGQL